MQSSRIIFGIAFAILTAVGNAQIREGLNPCSDTCIENVLASGRLSCAATDNACLCATADFRNGIRDCVQQSCPEGEVEMTMTYHENFCQPFAEAEPSVEEEPAAPSTVDEAPEAETPSTTAETEEDSPTTAPPADVVISDEPSSETEEPAETPSAEDVSSAVEDEVPLARETQTPSAASDPSPSVTPDISADSPSASTSDASGASASDSAKSEDDEEDDEDGAAAGAMSANAKIGVGIGAGVGALIIGVLLFLLIRQCRKGQKEEPPRRLQISEPLPGSGLDYTYGMGHIMEKQNSGSDLESNSRRYEDMLPRVTPRNMI